jgi:hypothetical protein
MLKKYYGGKKNKYLERNLLKKDYKQSLQVRSLLKNNDVQRNNKTTKNTVFQKWMVRNLESRKHYLRLFGLK